MNSQSIYPNQITQIGAYAIGTGSTEKSFEFNIKVPFQVKKLICRQIVAHITTSSGSSYPIMVLRSTLHSDPLASIQTLTSGQKTAQVDFVNTFANPMEINGVQKFWFQDVSGNAIPASDPLIISLSLTVEFLGEKNV